METSPHTYMNHMVISNHSQHSSGNEVYSPTPTYGIANGNIVSPTNSPPQVYIPFENNSPSEVYGAKQGYGTIQKSNYAYCNRTSQQFPCAAINHPNSVQMQTLSQHKSVSLSSPVSKKAFSPVNEFKSYTDITRERDAGIRALRLLETSVDHEKYLPGSANRTSAKTARQIRQAAIQRYEAKMARESVATPRRHALHLSKRPEKLAETTRKVKTHRSGYDPDLMRDKCQLDLDRQKLAEQRAVRMLNQGYIL